MKPTTPNDTMLVADLPENEAEALLKWIREGLVAYNASDGITQSTVAAGSADEEDATENPSEVVSSSYGLKHVYQSQTGFYVTENVFKDAMQTCGFTPVRTDRYHWYFSLHRRSPAFVWGASHTSYSSFEPMRPEDEYDSTSFYGWAVARYLGKDNPLGDFVKDMHEDLLWPKSNTEAVQEHYLACRGACKEAIDCFHELWREYRKSIGTDDNLVVNLYAPADYYSLHSYLDPRYPVEPKGAYATFDWLRTYFYENNWPPTIEAISQGVGIDVPTVYQHLNELESAKLVMHDTQCSPYYAPAFWVQELDGRMGDEEDDYDPYVDILNDRAYDEYVAQCLAELE